MARTKEPPVPTCYELLHVHPAAPQDLITAAYWKLTGLLQASRESDRAAEVALYNLTRAYQMLADHRAREAYDHSLALGPQPLPRIPLRRRSSWLPFARRAPEAEADMSIDYYELMRLDHRAHPAVVPEAYSVMRNHYLRLIEQGQARAELVYLLEDANEVLSDPLQRAEYDSRRPKSRRDGDPNAGAGTTPSARASATRSHNDDSLPAGGQPKVRSRSSPPRKPRSVKVAAMATRPARPRSAPRKRGVSANGRKPPVRRKTSVDTAPQMPAVGYSQDRATPAGGRAPQALKSFVANSVHLMLTGGKQSVDLARAASKAVRDIVEGFPSENGAAPADGEEETLLARLFIRAAGAVDNGRNGRAVPETPGISDTPVRTGVTPGSNRTAGSEATPSSSPPVSSDATLSSGTPAGFDARVLARLTVFEGESAGFSFDVSRVPLTLGGSDSCDIKLAGLAPQQVRLLYHGGQFALHALSGNPATCVQGTPVSWALLRDGDPVEVGPYRMSLSINQ